MTPVVTYTQARQNLKDIGDKVCNDSTPIRIQRKNGGDLVILSADDFDSMEETLYLMRSPKNAARLSKAMERVKQKKNLISFSDVDELREKLKF